MGSDDTLVVGEAPRAGEVALPTGAFGVAAIGVLKTGVGTAAAPTGFAEIGVVAAGGAAAATGFVATAGAMPTPVAMGEVPDEGLVVVAGALAVVVGRLPLAES